MDPVTFHGEAFSEYYCTRLLGTDPQLGKEINQRTAEELYRKASSTVRFAQRQLRDREQARSTYSLLLERLAPLLGWRLGAASKVVTELEQEEEGGVPLLDGGADRVVARAVCIAPDAHLDAAPQVCTAGSPRRNRFHESCASSNWTTGSLSMRSSCVWSAQSEHCRRTSASI